MSKPAIQKGHGAPHELATASAGALALVCSEQSAQATVVFVACASSEPGDVAFGVGHELSLAFAEGEDPQLPEWIQLLPAGPEILARDGRKWTLPDPQAVLDNFAANRADLPLDINHATEILGPKGGDAPAQGWIKALEVRDGAIWGRVEWNGAGARAVASKRYRYISPAMRHTKDGVVFGLSSAALVTHPALVMPALARSEGINPEDQHQMKTLAERLRATYGLPADANDDAIVQAADTQVSLARDARDPSKLVPKADLDAALQRATTAETSLASIQTASAEKAAAELVDGAISAGKIAPASREHWLSLARADADGTGKVIASLTPILDPTKTDKKVEGAGDPENHGLTADQLSLCASMGLEPKAFAATLKE